MTSASGAMRLCPGSPAGGSPAIAFGVCGPVSSPNLNIEGWSWNGTVKPPGVRIGQQFGWVKTKSPLRIVGTLDAEAVSRASAQPGRDAAQNAIGVVRHRRADDLPIAIIDAQRRALGVGQHERRFEAARRDEDAASGFWVAHAAGLMISR